MKGVTGEFPARISFSISTYYSCTPMTSLCVASFPVVRQRRQRRCPRREVPHPHAAGMPTRTVWLHNPPDSGLVLARPSQSTGSAHGRYQGLLPPGQADPDVCRWPSHCGCQALAASSLVVVGAGVLPETSSLPAWPPVLLAATPTCLPAVWQPCRRRVARRLETPSRCRKPQGREGGQSQD